MSRIAIASALILSSLAWMPRQSLAAEGADATALLGNLKPLSESALGAATGGAEAGGLDLASSVATNNSTVTGNTIGNIGGTGTISSNSLSATSGFTTLIANSGNQVTIAQSTIVNVFLH